MVVDTCTVLYTLEYLMPRSVFSFFLFLRRKLFLFMLHTRFHREIYLYNYNTDNIPTMNTVIAISRNMTLWKHEKSNKTCFSLAFFLGNMTKQSINACRVFRSQCLTYELRRKRLNANVDLFFYFMFFAFSIFAETLLLF